MTGLCQGCARTLSDGYLCPRCTNALLDTLATLPHLLGELAVTAYRQDRVAAPSAGRGSGERPLPYKAKATRLLADVRSHLLASAERLGRRLYPIGDLPLCEELAKVVPRAAASNPYVGAVLAGLVADELAIREVIDLPRSFRYLGRCDRCGTELYAEREAATWVCPGQDCLVSYDVTARMADLIERSRDVIATTSTIATALTSLDFPVTEERIRKWASRGLIEACDRPGRARWYRVGDVIDQVVRHRRKQAADQ